MPRADLHLVLELTEPCPQSSDIAAENRMLRHLFSAARRQRCNQPGRSTKFQRDENRAKIGAFRRPAAPLPLTVPFRDPPTKHPCTGARSGGFNGVRNSASSLMLRLPC